MIPKDKIDKAKKILEINQKIKSFGTAFIAKKIDDVEEEIGSLTKIVTDYIESVPFPQDGIDGVQGEKGEKGDRGEQGLHGMKGDKGDKGERGEKGEKGEDGFGIDGKDGKNGIDGKDGSPDTGEDIVQKINALALDPDLKIDASHIKNLPINNGGSGIGGRPLYQLPDVNITTPTNGQVLKYNSTTQLWENGTDVGGVAWGGITGTLSNQTDLQSALDLKVPTSRTLTINGTAYDLSADRSWTIATGISSLNGLTGATQTFATGTTGTDFGISSSGTIHTFNLPTASATNRGALSSTDWTTFNNKFTLPSLTAGSVLFSNGTTIAQDNTNFFWDDTNNRLGIGTNSPTEQLHLSAASGNVKQLIQVAGGATVALNLQSSSNIWSFAHQNNFHSGNLLLNFGGTSYTSNVLEVTTTGKFGFGTASPAEAIHLYAPSGDRKILSEVAGGATTAFILKGASTYWNIAMNSAFHSGNLLITNDNTFTTNAIEVSTTNRVGIGITSPTAVLHLKAGTATANTAPLKFESGTNLTTAEAGAMEYNGTSLMFTPSSAVRHGLIMGNTTNSNVFSQYLKGATAFSTGTGNTLIGDSAGAALTSGVNNVFLGYLAGNAITNGQGNQFIGKGAGQATGTGTIYTTLIGTEAGRGSGSLDQSIFIGWQAGINASASYSQFIGGGGGATSAHYSFFGGYAAGSFATGANNSVFLGYRAGYNATGATESIFIGKYAGYNAGVGGVTGTGNIGIGLNSGSALSSGTYNTFLGYKAGDALTTGSKNVAIGYDVDLASNTADGQLTIQNAIFGTGNTGVGTTASTGKIGIYTPAPTCALDVTGGIATSRTTVTAPATTDGNIFSGTYTPTLTGITNVTSSTAYVCQYMRVGNVVTVSGKIEVTPTINNTQTTIGISLPIASNFANSNELGGTSHTVANTVAGHGAAIYADATNDRAEMDYFETHGASDTFAFSFTYKII